MIIYLLTTIILFSGISMSQDFNFASRLNNEYENFKETSLTKKRFKHSDILPLINQLKNSDIFTVNKAGVSSEGRDIFLISIGSGKKKIFLWSQMHGDEPTATMALFDIFNFFRSDNGFDDFKKELLEKVTIYFMPMVNPDGAEVYQRRNLYDIDINRDAVRQQTPEAIILRETFEKLNADFGFNLHDQSTRYSAGISPKSATLSFLAPAFNYDKDVNDIRKNAVLLIAQLNKVLSQFIPGHIAKYNDDFEPRAFGDNFQKWGTSTILIESGGWKDDPEKQYIRKLNFIALLYSFKSISEEEYRNETEAGYEKIPFNENYLFDVLIRNLTVKQFDNEYLIDLGINQIEVNNDEATDYYTRGSLQDLGDLSVYYGYDDHDLKGYEIVPGKIYPAEFSSLDEIANQNFKQLFLDGYTSVILKGEKPDKKFTDFPINVYINNHPEIDEEVELEDSPNFIIKKNGEVKYVIMNGFFIDPNDKIDEKVNGLIR